MANPATSASGQEGATAPIDLQLRFDCLSPQNFIERHGGDLSRGGIFVRSRERLAVGRMVKLDLQLGDGSPLIVGDGTVFWTRDPDAARGEQEFGMGVRFGRLTPQSQKMLAYLLAEKAERERIESRLNNNDDQDERTVVATQEQIMAAQDPADAAAASRPSMARLAVPPSLMAVPAAQPVPAAQAAPAAQAVPSVSQSVPAAAAPAPAAQGVPEAEMEMVLSTSEALPPDSEDAPPELAAPPAWEDSADEVEAPRPRWMSNLRIVGGIAFLAAAAALIPMLFPKAAAKASVHAVATPLVAQAAPAPAAAAPPSPLVAQAAPAAAVPAPSAPPPAAMSH
jgi:uncharacterized protein (TIGR02266 family)